MIGPLPEGNGNRPVVRMQGKMWDATINHPLSQVVLTRPRLNVLGLRCDRNRNNAGVTLIGVRAEVLCTMKSDSYGKSTSSILRIRP